MVSSDDIVRSDSKMDDVQIETADILSKFKFFETYKPPEKEKKSFRITPPRDFQGNEKVSNLCTFLKKSFFSDKSSIEESFHKHFSIFQN